MSTVAEGTFNFKNGLGHLTRKGHWIVENPNGTSAIRVTVEYCDVTNSFVDNQVTWYAFVAGGGPYEVSTESLSAYNSFKSTHAADLSIHSHTWWPEGS